MAGLDTEKDVKRHSWLRRSLATIGALAVATGVLMAVILSGGDLAQSLVAATGVPDVGKRGAGLDGRRLRSSGGDEDHIHVCFCTDDTDLRALVVAIRSALASATDPTRLRFHLVTAGELVPLFKEAMKKHLPGVPVDVRHSATLQNRIHTLMSFRDTSRARRELATPFNLAAFYLHDFLTSRKGGKVNAKRVIHIDTDSVILGDLAELYDMDLRGRTIAAVKNCKLRWEDYIDFEVLHSFGFTGFDPQGCVIERSIFMYDVQQWVKKNMTGKIEDWLVRYHSSTDDLWFDGMSTAPWMLAVDGDYMELGEEWGCQGAGRESMTIPESQNLRRSGFDYAAFQALGVQFSEYGRIQPYMVMCSANAKLLHFNGGMRPWLVDRFKKMAPPCVLPVVLQGQEWKWTRRVKVYCEESIFVACPEIWWKHISEEAACALKDFDKEWQEDEDKWTDHQMDDEEAKRAAEREARQKLGMEEQEKLQREDEMLRERRRERFRLQWGSEESLKKRKVSAKEAMEKLKKERARTEAAAVGADPASAAGDDTGNADDANGEGEGDEEGNAGEEEVEEEASAEGEQ